MKVKKTPSGRYTVQIRIGDRRVRITADTKTECELTASAMKAEKSNTGRFRASDVTLGEAIDQYISERSSVLSPSTLRGYEAIRQNRFSGIMDKSLRSVRSWQRVVNDESSLCSAKTLKNAWGFVNSVLKEYGVDTSVRLPMVMPKERAFLPPEDLKRFVAAIEGHPHELAYLLCLHGLRRSEMLALEKSDVTDTIRVSKSRVKGTDHRYVTKPSTKTASSARSVPIFIPRIKELVAKRPEGVLVTAKPETLIKHLKAVCQENDLPEVSLHELRHSFASLCYHLGISEKMCMQFGGWNDYMTMRKIYTHIADSECKRAASDLTAFFV